MKNAFRVAVAVLFLAIPLALFSVFAHRVSARSSVPDGSAAADPWSASQTVTPDTLAKELNAPGPSKKPMIVCVGFRPLYQGAHIPGASFHGAGSTPQGIADLKTWAQDVPRAANIVLYCGCCPLEHCPNLKPAFATMHDLGFTNLRVLLLPHDFNSDWIEKGYPVEKGK
jgi:thiosulfate/3-mercaptopyruvate sulfurtransferase